jgi:HK97 family phage prohead protease
MDDDSRRVEGYALVFNSESRDLGGIIEVIDSHALDGVLPNSDVMCWLNHDSSRGALARRRGENVPQSAVGNSLELEIDDIGLRYAFDAPDTALGNELIEGLKRGDINQSSFAFTVKEDTWERLDDGMVLRTINKIERLYDVSPVYDPAYYGTSVELDRRGYDELLEREEKERLEKEAELKAEITDYYTELRSYL